MSGIGSNTSKFNKKKDGRQRYHTQKIQQYQDTIKKSKFQLLEA